MKIINREKLDGCLFSRRDLARLILPLALEQLLAVTIGLADTMMVTSAGEAAVSGISVVDSINVLFVQFFSALATGGAVIVSQYLGKRDSNNANHYSKQLIYSSVALSLLIMTLPLILSRQTLRLIYRKLENDVMASAEVYFRITLTSYPFLAIYNSCAALFRSMNNSKVTLFTSAVMNIVNISGNALLIYGFSMGAAGAGLSTLASRVVGAAIILILITRSGSVIHIQKLLNIRFDLKAIGKLLSVGMPTGIEGSMFQIGKLLVQGLVTSIGTYAIAADAVSNSIASLMSNAGNAISHASITIVGRCMGSRETEQAEMYANMLLVLAHSVLFVFAVTVFVFTPNIVALFNLSEAASVAAIGIVRLYCIMTVLIWPASFALPNVLRAAGDTRFTMIVSTITMWAFRVVTSYVLTGLLNAGLWGVWIGMYIDWIARAVCFIIRFRRGKWKEIKLV